jgi:pyruvate,orthophosphate dikinase
VLKWLAELHVRVLPFIGRVTQISPRLSAYGARLNRAAERIADGDHRYVARIIADSYHTVWFELHEDLIALAGRTRADEPCAAQAERLLRA